MEFEVQAWGEDAAIRLPVEMDLKVGDKFTVETYAVGVLMLKRKSRYSLAELVLQCDIAASQPSDMVGWDSLKSIGREKY